MAAFTLTAALSVIQNDDVEPKLVTLLTRLPMGRASTMSQQVFRKQGKLSIR